MSAASAASSAGTPGTPLIRRVSRRELAQNVRLWQATIGMYLVLSAVTLATILSSGAGDRPRLITYLVCVTAVAAIFIRSEPPPIDSWRNHLLLAAVSLTISSGMWVFQPDPEIAIAFSLFIAPLIAVRLQSRRAIIAHFIGTSAMFYGLAIIALLTGCLNTTSILACAMIVFGTWALGTSTMITLEAAEAQGDELERLVRRDPLTGVGNRRMLNEYLEDELPRHTRIGRPLSFLALDLNGFKELNDTVGHAAGDELLRVVAETLVDAVGPRDIVVRQGGDEFCIVLPETSLLTAQRTANTIRTALAGVNFEGQRVSSGIGIATYPDDADSGDVLLHLADQRLAESKRR